MNLLLIRSFFWIYTCFHWMGYFSSLLYAVRTGECTSCCHPSPSHGYLCVNHLLYLCMKLDPREINASSKGHFAWLGWRTLGQEQFSTNWGPVRDSAKLRARTQNSGFQRGFQVPKTEVAYCTSRFLNNWRSKPYILQAHKRKKARVCIENFKIKSWIKNKTVQNSYGVRS